MHIVSEPNRKLTQQFTPADVSDLAEAKGLLGFCPTSYHSLDFTGFTSRTYRMDV